MPRRNAPAKLLVSLITLLAAAGCATVPPLAPPAAEPAAAPAPAPTRWTWTDYEIVGQRELGREEIAALVPVELGTPYVDDQEIYERCNEALRAALDVAYVVCSNVLFLDGRSRPTPTWRRTSRSAPPPGCAASQSRACSRTWAARRGRCWRCSLVARFAGADRAQSNRMSPRSTAAEV